MKIKLNDNLEYDNELSLSEQTEEVQAFISEVMNGEAVEHFEEQINDLPKVPRLISKWWHREEFSVEEVYQYNNHYNHPQSGIHTTRILIYKFQ